MHSKKVPTCVFVEIRIEVSCLLAANHGCGQLGANALECRFNVRPQHFVRRKQFECRIGDETSMAAGKVGAEPGVVKQRLTQACTRRQIRVQTLFEPGNRAVGITFERDDQQPVLVAECAVQAAAQ